MLGVVAHVHGGQLPQFLLWVHPKVGCCRLQSGFRLGLLEVVIAKGVEGETETIFVDEWRCKHRVHDTAIDGKSAGVKPPCVIGCVMHDLVCAGGEDFLYPAINSGFVKVTTALMGNRVIAGPSVHSNSVANNKTIASGPARSKRLHIWVTSFEVNCNLLGG